MCDAQSSGLYLQCSSVVGNDNLTETTQCSESFLFLSCLLGSVAHGESLCDMTRPRICSRDGPRVVWIGGKIKEDMWNRRGVTGAGLDSGQRQK